MTTIEQQIKEQMHKAFYDIIEENINSNKPDYEWLTRLYSEIRQMLLAIVKKDSKTYKKIESDFDVMLFKQMIENDVFDFESAVKLINNTFFWVKSLQAPVRDKATEDAKDRVFKSEPKKIIPVLLK